MARMEVVLLLGFLAGATALNDKPIIGVLSQELDTEIEDNYSKNYSSYIAASYVKFLESSGSRVVPVWTNQSAQYYEYIINSLNGLLIPGGAAPFTATDGYAAAAWELYKLAKQKNNAGIYFPVWGTCLGFEILAVFSANRTDIRNRCDVVDIAMPLVFKPDYRSSKLYKDDPDGVLAILEKQNVTFNSHYRCITEENLRASGVADKWHILSVNKHNGTEFISSFEHNKYPFYGVQFHPEKNAFEWKIESIPHSADAILVEQFFGNFFINEARKNNNSFSNTKEERAALIYNYPVTHTGDKIVFEQSYFFTHEQQVFTPPSTTTSTSTTTTTTTTAPATTTTTTAATTTAGEVTRPNTELPGTTAAQSHGKKSAASAHNSVAYVTLCTAMFLAWVVKQ